MEIEFSGLKGQEIKKKQGEGTVKGINHSLGNKNLVGNL